MGVFIYYCWYSQALERSNNHNLHNVEKADCCKPNSAPEKWGPCYEERVWMTIIMAVLSVGEWKELRSYGYPMVSLLNGEPRSYELSWTYHGLSLFYGIQKGIHSFFRHISPINIGAPILIKVHPSKNPSAAGRLEQQLYPEPQLLDSETWESRMGWMVPSGKLT